MIKESSSNNYQLTNADKINIAIIMSEYHGDLNRSMESAARSELQKAGIPTENIHTLYAPGSWEIPVIAKAAAESGKFDALIALGVIVKGETYHFEMIADNVGRALCDIQTDYKMPVGLEVLAVYDIEQAKVRTSGEHNKGTEAAGAVVKALETIYSI